MTRCAWYSKCWTLEEASELANVLELEAGLLQGAVGQLTVCASSNDAGESLMEIDHCLEDDDGEIVRSAWVTLDPAEVSLLARLLGKTAAHSKRHLDTAIDCGHQLHLLMRTRKQEDKAKNNYSGVRDHA